MLRLDENQTYSNHFYKKSRYLPTESEKKILIKGLNCYFSQPNYSKNRKTIISEISEILFFIMTQKETDSLPTEDSLLFFIQNYSTINHNLEKEGFDDDEFEEKLNFHYKIGLRLLKRWTSVIK